MREQPAPLPQCGAVALVDFVSAHRDIAAYYGQFGFLDRSTTREFVDRVVLPSLRATATTATTSDGAAAHRQAPAGPRGGV
jgi:hypothetical protein